MKARFAEYCICGASMTGTVSPAEKATKLVKMFRDQHSGDEHAPCDARTASRAREREKRELAKRDRTE